MSILTFPFQKTVFLMSDTGLGIYQSGLGSVSFVANVPWDDEAFEQTAADIALKKCGGRPIVILNDMVEQHYRKERVIKKGVSFLDRQSMVKSKLRFAFPNYPIRASQKQSAPSTKDKKQDASSDVYLFTALPESDAFKKTLKAAELSYAQINGIALLPIESVPMVRALEKKLSGKTREEASWVVFIGHHKSGALRQIVVKDDFIALTRISPIVETYENPSAWAQNVVQEFKGTMSYVARFGYDERDPLSVIAISDVAAGQTLKEQIGGQFQYQSMDAEQAAKLLGLKLDSSIDTHYADSLHAGWITKKPGLVLGLVSEKAEKVAMPRKAAKFFTIAAVLVLCFLLYTFVNSYISFDNLNKDIAAKNKELTLAQRDYDTEIARQKELGLDANMMSAVLALSDEIDETNVNYLKIIQVLGQALGPNMSFDRVLLQPFTPDLQGVVTTRGGSTQAEASAYSAKLQIMYPSTVNVNRANRELEELRLRIAGYLQGHTIELSKKLKDTAYIDEIVVQTGGEQDKPEIDEQDFIAEIVMQGPVI